MNDQHIREERNRMLQILLGYFYQGISPETYMDSRFIEHMWDELGIGDGGVHANVMDWIERHDQVLGSRKS